MGTNALHSVAHLPMSEKELIQFLKENLTIRVMTNRFFTHDEIKVTVILSLCGEDISESEDVV